MMIFRSVPTNNKPGIIRFYDVLWYVKAKNNKEWRASEVCRRCSRLVDRTSFRCDPGTLLCLFAMGDMRLYVRASPASPIQIAKQERENGYRSSRIEVGVIIMPKFFLHSFATRCICYSTLREVLHSLQLDYNDMISRTAPTSGRSALQLMEVDIRCLHTRLTVS